MGFQPCSEITDLE